jgi:glutathionylspermidine synthase
MVRRRVTNIRNNWKEKLEGVGFHFYEMEGLPYWDESAYYEFSSGQIDHLEAVTNELYEMCIELVGHVIKEDLLADLAIPEGFHDYVRRSWEADEPSIYGRFDFWYDGKSEPKLLEFNADTPTALFEASVVQYYWLQDFDSRNDQFNSLHEGLLEVMKEGIKDFVGPQVLYFSCVKESLEDYTTVEYLRDVAIQAGLNTAHIFIDDVGYDSGSGRFVDLSDGGINRMFKLYPWEWLIREPFAKQLLTSGIRLLEPAWKMVLSNKAILPLLWERYPAHKNLLPAYFRPPRDGRHYVQKPFFSREGEGIYVSDRFGIVPPEVIFQEYRELPSHDGNYPVVGSWIIGGEARGMGIREDTTTITNNLSRFVPHLFG